MAGWLKDSMERSKRRGGRGTSFTKMSAKPQDGDEDDQDQSYGGMGGASSENKVQALEKDNFSQAEDEEGPPPKKKNRPAWR